jgi:L-malate glycosyltransferase
MRILMVISQFYPLIGGAEKQAQILAKTLTRKGTSVRIVTGWWRIHSPRKETIAGVQVFRNFACWGMFGIKGLRPLGAFVYMLSLGIYLVIHNKEYDLIHVHQALYPAFVCVFIGKKLLKKPVFAKSSSSGITSDIEWLKKFPLGEFQLNYLLKHINYVVAVSKKTGNEFEEIGFPKVKIEYIPNGVELPLKKESFEQTTLQVTTITRMSFEKGVDILLQAWANVIRASADLRLRIIGDGPLRADMEKLSGLLSIQNRVDFVGRADDTGDYYRSTSLFVLPSRTEGLPNVLLEAMSYGIPCIATRVGGNPELIGEDEPPNIDMGGFRIGRNGILVNPEDAEGLSEAILHLVKNSVLRQELGERGRQFIQGNYSIESVADRYLAFYRRLMKEAA